MLNKEECENTVTRLYRPYFALMEVQNAYHDINGKHESINKDMNLIEQLIQEHFELIEKYNNTKVSLDNISKEFDELVYLFDNQKPYKIEELKEGVWVWDDIEKECIHINAIFKNKILFTQGETLGYATFEDNRFFPVQKANIREDK